MMKLSRRQFETVNDSLPIKIKRGIDFANIGDFIWCTYEKEKISLLVCEKTTQLKIGGLTMEDPYYTLIERKEIC